MPPLTITFIGPQGSGKGTQAANVRNYLKETSDKPIVDLETGRGFRAMAEGESYTGERVRDLLAEGELVPNFLTSSIVMNEVAQRLTKDSHLVIDGFPRNLDQARVLKQMMEFYQRDTLIVFHLDVPDAVVLERLKGRQRADDTEELIAERLRLYRAQTVPLVEHYEQEPGVVVATVDASQPIDAVFSSMQATLERFL